MALLSQLDKVQITADILSDLENRDIQNNATLVIEVDLTAGSTSETTITDNSWDISVTV